MNAKLISALLLGGAVFMSPLASAEMAANPTPAPAATPAPAPTPAPSPTPAPAPAMTTDAKLDKQYSEHASFKTFLSELQTAAADEDKKAVAGMVKYPFKTKIDGKDTTVANEKDFAKSYDDVVKAGVALAIKNADYEKLTVTPAGVALGNGEVWFTKDGTGADAKVKIIAINAP